MATKTFMRGAVVLGVAGIIIKLLGAVFRIPLANLIGDTGMAYYQAVYPVYVLFLTLATAGIPIAISRMVSERIATGNHYEAYRVFRISFVLLMCIGVASFSICFFGSNFIVNIIGMEEAELAMKSIAPALLLVPLMASYRGYFQGQQDMSPTAVSQVIEQLCRVTVGLTLAYFMLTKGLDYAAAGAAFGATAGAVGGLTVVIIIFLSRKKRIFELVKKENSKAKEQASSILCKIFIIAVPITIGAAIMPIMNFIDAGMVVNRLEATGWTAQAAKSLYGQLTGFAGPLINFPQVLTQAVAMSLVPTVAAAYKLKDMNFLRDNVETGLRMAVIMGFPCAFGLMVLAEPIMLLLYPLKQASAISAAPCLMIMAVGVVFLSTVQTLTGVLQGVGKQMIPVRNMFIGAICKVILTYWLTGIPSINVKGAAIGTVVAYIIAATLNIMAVRKYTGAKFDIKLTFGKPLLTSLIMATVALCAYRIMFIFFGNAMSCLVAIILAAITYFIMLFITKTITREEVLTLPKGKKLVKIIDKFVK